MQPNLQVPQAPYIMYPSYKLPRNSILDVSLDALMEQKLREVQNANRQRAVDARTPKVLFDPLLNLRVRDYYREKYQRSVGTEVAGRVFGAAEGAALGLGIALTIAGVVVAVAGLLEPTPAGEGAGAAIAASGVSKLGAAIPAVTNTVSKVIPGAVAAAKAAETTGVMTVAAAAPSFLVGSGVIGAGVGGTAGLIGSDYTTYYATRDMFSNLIMPQSVGAGVLNSLNFVGSTMDMVGTATVVKSTLYALINNESIAETIAKSYGLHEEGRTEINFSDIRESLGLDFGGVGNFFVDMAGEFGSDLGAIAGISPLVTDGIAIGRVLDTGGLARKATAEVAENTAKAINKAGTNIFSEGFFKTKAAKPFLKAILDNDIDSFKHLIKVTNLGDDIDKNLIDDALIEKFLDSVTKAAAKKTVIKVRNAFKTIDVIDDALTRSLWKISSPVIGGTYAVKKISESNLIPKTLAKFLTDENIYKLTNFFKGNQTIYRKIENMMPEKTRIFLKNRYHAEITRMAFGNSSFDKIVSDYASSLTDVNLKKDFLDNLSNKKITSLKQLKEDGLYYEQVKEFFSKKLSEKQEVINKIKKSEDEITEKLLSGNLSKEESKKLIKELEDLYNQEAQLIGDQEYISLEYVIKHFDNPDEFEELKETVTGLYSLSRYDKQYGLNDIQKAELDKHIETLIKAYIREHRTGKTSLATEYFDSFYKPMRKFIMDNMSSAIKAEVTSYYNDSVGVFNKEFSNYSSKFKESFVRVMKRRIEKGISSQDEDIQKAYKEFLQKFEEADTIDKRYSLVNKFLNNMSDVDKKLSKKLATDQSDMLKKRAVLKKFKDTFKDVMDKPDTLNEPTRYFPASDSIKYAKDRKEYTDAIINMVNISGEEFRDIEEMMEIIDESTDISDELVTPETIKFVNELIGGVYKITPATAQLTRLIFRTIPKYIKEEKTDDALELAIKIIRESIGPRHKANKLLDEIEDIFKDKVKYHKMSDLELNQRVHRLQDKLSKMINDDHRNARITLKSRRKALKRSISNIDEKIKLAKNRLERMNFSLSKIHNITKISEIDDPVIKPLYDYFNYGIKISSNELIGFSNIPNIIEDALFGKNDAIFKLRQHIFYMDNLIRSNPNHPYINFIKEINIYINSIYDMCWENLYNGKYINFNEIDILKKDIRKHISGLKDSFTKRVYREYIPNKKIKQDAINKLNKSLERQIFIKSSLESLIPFVDTYDHGFTAISKYLDSINNFDYDSLVNDSISLFINNIKRYDLEFGNFIDQYTISFNRLVNVLELANAKYNGTYDVLLDYLSKFPNKDMTDKDYESLAKALKSFININSEYTQLVSIFKNNIPLKLSIENDSFKLSVVIPEQKSSKEIFYNVHKIITRNTKGSNINLLSIRDELETYLKNLPNNEELMKSLQEESPELYKYIKDITSSPKKLNKVLNNSPWKSEEIFQDIYGSNKVSSFAYKPSGFKNKSIFGSKIIIFDTETTGSTSNGLYSLTARVISYDENGKSIMEEPISFYLADNAKEWGQWTIDADVDKMYKHGVKGVVKELNSKQRGYASSKELALAFKSWLDTNHKDSVLIAHNASFDFNQFMNTMSGGLEVDEITGNILPNAAKEFAENSKFEYAILDSNIMQNFLYLVGDTKFSTNKDLGIISKYVDTLEIRELSKYNIVALYNGERIDLNKIKSIKSKSKHLLTIRTNSEGSKVTYNGGDLHEAVHDVELMSAWTQEMFDKLGQMNATFDSLEDVANFSNKILNDNYVKFLDSDEFGENIPFINSLITKLDKLHSEGYRYKKLENLREALNIIISQDSDKYTYADRLGALEIIQEYIEDSRKISESEYNADHPVYMSYKVIQNGDGTESIIVKWENTNRTLKLDTLEEFQDWYKSKNKYSDGKYMPSGKFYDVDILSRNSSFGRAIDSIIENTPNNPKYGDSSDLIQSVNREDILDKNDIQQLIDIIDIYNEYDTKLNRQINIYKQMRSGKEVGTFQQNRVYTMFQIAENFKRDPSIQGLIDLFNGNKGGNLSGILAEYAKIIEKNIDDELYTPLKQLRNDLLSMQTAVYWYNNIIEEINPAALDTFDNVMRMIENGKSDSDILVFICKRAKQNNFNSYEMIQLYQRILQNKDNIMLPTARYINNLYMRLKDDLTSILKRQEGNPEKIRNDLPSQQYAGKEIIELVDDAINAMRGPLRNAKAQNRVYAKSPLTIKELEAHSKVTKDFVEQSRKAGVTNYDYGPEFKFTNEAHTIRPYEAVYRNSRKVFKYNGDVQPYVKLKNKVNAIEADNFKETERLADLPLVDYQHNRLSQLYALAAKASGIDDITFINNIHNFYDYSNLAKHNPLYQSLYESLLNGEITPEELGMDPIVFSEFVSTIMSLNENSFSYIKDINVLKTRLINSLMYNVLKNKKYEELAKSLPDISENVNTKLFNINNYSAYNESIKLFQDTISNFIDINGNLNTQGLINFFKNHPEYTLVFLDNNGNIHKLAANEQVLNSSEFMEAVMGKHSSVSIMSEDNFISLAKNIQPQEIKNPVFRWARNHILRNIKMLSLVNMNFMLQNAFAASLQNIISMEGVINIPKFVTSMINTAKDYHRFKKIMMQVTGSKSIAEFAGTSITSIETKWIDIIQNPEFLETLSKNGEEDLVKLIKSLSPKDIEMLQELSILSNTSAAYGEVNSITRNKQRELKAIKESEDADKRLKEIYGIDFMISREELEKLKKSGKYTSSQIQEIENLRATASKKKYDNMSTKKLKAKLIEIDNDIKERGKAYSNELRLKVIINDILNSRQYKVTDNIFKYTCISGYKNIKINGVTRHVPGFLDINNDMETIFRISAMRNYMSEGMTLDQATYEVIRRQFLYNDKSQAEQYAEFLVPFISYPLRMVKLAENMTHDSTVMDLLFWMNMYSWDEEETEQQEHSEYLTRRRARGDIPIGDKLVQFTSPFNEGIMNFQNPLYSLNNKLNPLLKPFVDLATDQEYVRWNHLPVISQVDSVSTMIKERNIMSSFVNDFYRYNQFGNYYRPRVNNRITGTFYNNLYTSTGRSRVSMNMQPLNNSNLKYRINAILYSGPKR